MDLRASDNSTIAMFGGSIGVSGAELSDRAWLNWIGGEINQLRIFDASVVPIAGMEFAVDGVPGGPGGQGAHGLVDGTD
jgi:hypothetical protein